MRIVSLLPSATEIVCALGLGDELVGVTHECDWPPEVIGKPVVTHDTHLHDRPSGEIHALVTAAMHGGSSLYALDDEKLEALEPDLILTQELCRVCAVSYREVNEVARAIDASITVISLEPTSIEGSSTRSPRSARWPRSRTTRSTSSRCCAHAWGRSRRW